MNTCALVSAAKDDACAALGLTTRPVAGLDDAASRLDWHRPGRSAAKTLPSTVKGFSTVFSGSWRQRLRENKVVTPVGNVFGSNVPAVDFPFQERSQVGCANKERECLVTLQGCLHVTAS
jgi:hypothetical protein